jgi:hypothetical protein
MKTSLTFAITFALGAGCLAAEDPPTGELEQRLTLAAPVIADVVDAGSAMGSHYLTLWGTFPAPPSDECQVVSTWRDGTALDPADGCHAVDVRCNGALIQPAVITGYVAATGQINVAFPDRPAASRCTVIVKRFSEDDGDAPVASNETWVGTPTSIVALSAPALEIRSVTDLGTVSGTHSFDVYGAFPRGPLPTDDWHNFAPVVRCGGGFLTGQTTGGSAPTRIRIAFADATPTVSKSCTFEIRRTADQAQSQRWHQRIDGTAPSLNSRIGAYFWGRFQSGPLEAGNVAATGYQRIRNAGIVGPIRIAMGPKQRGNPARGNSPALNAYNINWAPCPEGTNPGTPQNVPAQFLPCAAGLPAFQAMFDLVPPATKIIITAMDSTSSGDNEREHARYVDDAWLSVTANYNLVKAEYYQLALKLLDTRTGRPNGRTFIIANWEGDNLLYCGGVYGVVAGWDFDTCPVLALEGRKEALIKWMTARKQGIAEAKAARPEITDVSIDDGVEFAAYALVKECGGDQMTCPDLPDVLHDVVPEVLPKYALYSAWESLGNGRFEGDLYLISQFLAPYNTINIVGEWGMPGYDNLTGDRPIPTWVFKEVTRAFLRSSFQSAVTWHAYPADDEMSHLLDHDGDEMPSGMTALRAGTVAPPASSPLMVARAINGAGTTGGKRYFEVWGDFTNGHDVVAYVRCHNDLFAYVGTQVYRDTHQVNFWITDPAPGTEMWCVAYLQDTVTTAWRSNDVGPAFSCGLPTCRRFR